MAEDMKKFHFADLNAAYDFYNEYGRIKGFSIRRSKLGRNSEGEIVWQQFLCSREGERESKYLEVIEQKKERKKKTRCGCKARMRVHMEMVTGRWYITIF